MSDCRFGVSPVNYPNHDPESLQVKDLLGQSGGGRGDIYLF